MKKSNKFPIFCIVSLVLISAIVLSTACVSPQSIIPAKYTPTTTLPTQGYKAAPATPYPAEQVPVSTPVVENTMIAPTLTSKETQFTSYINSKYGFSIDYPANWETNEIDLDLLTTDPGIRVVEFYSPSTTRCNSKDIECVSVRSEVVIDVDNYPFTKVLEDYYIKDVARITSAGGAEITRSQSLIKLSNAKAYSLDYNSGSGADGIKVLRAYTLIGGNAYIITYHAHYPKSGEEDQFTKYYNDVEHMRKSFLSTGAMKII